MENWTEETYYFGQAIYETWRYCGDAYQIGESVGFSKIKSEGQRWSANYLLTLDFEDVKETYFELINGTLYLVGWWDATKEDYEKSKKGAWGEPVEVKTYPKVDKQEIIW